jgi:transketolase
MVQKKYSKVELQNKAIDIRRNIVKLFGKVGGGHFGGSLSSVDIIVALYYSILKIDPGNPGWADRDRFILSKGHSCPALYTVFADLGYFPKKWFDEFEEIGNPLTMHPDMHKVPGIDFSTGSLGHGLSLGAGMALAGKMDKKDYKVFVLMGDAEVNEGSIWEAAMAASRFKLDNLIGIIDRNMLSVDGRIEEIMPLEPLSDKWSSFGWVVEEVNGHDINGLINIFKKIPFEKGKPSMVVAHTIKGKGISFFEDRRECHRIDISNEQVEMALSELEKYKHKP